MAEVDAAAAWDTGTLRTLVRGTVRQLRRGQRPGEVTEDVAVPVARLVNQLLDAGDEQAADGILVHAFHDGVTPTQLARAFRGLEAGGPPPRPGRADPGGDR